MPRLELFFMGPPKILLDGAPVEPDTRKSVALLAYLALAGGARRREELVALFWPDYGPDRAAANLRRTLWGLNRGLGKVGLEVSAESLALAEGGLVWVDVDAFRARLAETGGHGHPSGEFCPACLEPLSAAAGLYRGDFLSGFGLPDSPEFDEWQFFQAEGLRGELAGTLDRLAGLHEKRGEFDLAIRYARRWLELDRLHEPAYRLLMRLYAAAGQRSAALHQYTTLAQLLRKELEAEPEEETVALYEMIKAERAQPTPLASVPPSSSSLPLSPLPFIGREAELAEVARMLADPGCRLLTLTGPGGVGKTRLALQIAAAARPDFPDGVYFIPLAALSDPALAATTLACSLNLRETDEQDALEAIRSALRGRQALLLLDNFEHLLSAAHLVAELLASTPELKILVTSRLRLGLYEEQDFPVPPLSLPGPNGRSLEDLERCESVRLFVQRARAVRPAFRLDDTNAAVVAMICTRLDGLPLAIELAAARLRLLEPAQLLARLDRRLPLLTGGPRDLPERQRTLRDTIAWSVDLLSSRAQADFRRLAVFAGGFSLDAVEAVWEDGAGEDEILDRLEGLVDASLVMRTEEGGEARFFLLETLREFALDGLQAAGEAERFQRRQAEFFLSLAETADPHLRGSQQISWLECLEHNRENLRAALAWFLEAGETESALRLTAALSEFWWYRAHIREGRGWLERALKLSTGLETAARARALYGLGQLVWEQAEADLAQAYYRESLDLAQRVGDGETEAFALGGLGYVAGSRGDYETAAALTEAGLAVFRHLKDMHGEAASLSNLGVIHFYRGDLAEAGRLFETSRALFTELDNQWGKALSLYRLGFLADRLGDSEQAERLYADSLPLWQALGSRGVAAHVKIELGVHALRRGDHALAQALAEESRNLLTAAGELPGLDRAANLAGYAALLSGEIGQALTQFRLAFERQVPASPGESLAGFMRRARRTYEPLEHSNDLGNLSYTLLGLAGCAGRLLRPDLAGRLLKAAEAARRALGFDLIPAHRSLLDQVLAPVPAVLAEPDLAALEAGQADLVEGQLLRSWLADLPGWNGM